ncbi:MAG TPA: FAD-dependent oxidoreductase [Microlunatus sp.]
MTAAAGLVVVGSGPAGLAAIRSFRERETDAPLMMITNDPSPPYARPPLTKDFLRGHSTIEDLWLTEPGWFDEQRVGVRLGTAAVALDVERRRVRLGDGSEVPYEDVVLATGSTPIPLPVPGGDDPSLVYVRDLGSGHRLREIAESSGTRVAVIGSGFIGCEAAASLSMAGIAVVLISDEALPHAARLGPDAGREIHRWLIAAGVETRLGVPLADISRRGGGFTLGLGDGHQLDVDHIVGAGGARPDLAVAERSGLLVENGGVRVASSMQASAPHTYAVGDIAFADHAAAGRPLRVEHWGDAERHGTIAGTIAGGGSASWREPPGFWSTIGDQTLKYSAWGDGYDEWVTTGSPDRWTIWYRLGEEICGVLTHNDDDAYEQGQRLLARRAPFSEIH